MKYNYKKFNAKEYDFSKSNGLQVGEIVPNFKLISLNGNDVYLFDETNKIVVLEAGSITCPLYSGNIVGMNKLAKDYPEIDFKVLYVREAHPGKKILHHGSVKEKLKLANNIKNYFPENREILIDEIDGNVHEKLGLLPNTVLVIGKNKKILYKIDWNNTSTLSEVLKNVKENKSIKGIVPKFRPAPINIVFPVLFRAGNDALFDFLVHLPSVILQRSKKFFSSSK